MENSESKKGRTLSIAFIVVLVAVALFTVIGMIAMRHQPLVLQGQAEATEIRISGKLPGRIDTFLVEEGQWVRQGRYAGSHQQSDCRGQVSPGGRIETSSRRTEQED